VVQPTLFDTDAAEVVLTDDERGRVSYEARFVEGSVADTWFGELRRDVKWRSMRRQMYDREVDVPRLIAGFRLDSPSSSLPRAIEDVSRRVIDKLGVPFNSVGLNLYRNGRDSVAPHNDHLYEIREGFPIALVSLGAARRFTIRAKTPPRRVIHVDLEPGSLLVMDYDTQLHYTHAVPKTTEPVGERISLAFRVKPERALDGKSAAIYDEQ
jgi:alkylated DNA repair dioxygenase AlkB